MVEKSSDTLWQQVIDHPEGVERNGTGLRRRVSPGGSIPFQDWYLADPNSFCAVPIKD
jgi:hypothetical protein